jgi:DNA-binding NtrC family response regulator
MSTGSILLVDDEAKILNALAQALREDRHEVVATTSAREAQRLLSQRMFDLFVVDNLMPELTGLDLIRELSTQPASERPQIIMMTAHATVESAIEAMKLGASTTCRSLSRSTSCSSSPTAPSNTSACSSSIAI